MGKMRTREEIERLKQNWEADPCWELEHTEGFEAHRDELAEYARGSVAKWDKKFEAKAAAHRERLGLIAYIGRYTSLGSAVVDMGDDDLVTIADSVSKVIRDENLANSAPSRPGDRQLLSIIARLGEELEWQLEHAPRHDRDESAKRALDEARALGLLGDQ